MLEILYSYILYTSDDPQKFKYFSDPFTNRINSISHFQFIEDKKIEEKFFTDIIRNKSSKNFEKKLNIGTDAIRNSIQNKNISEARLLSQKSLDDFESGLLAYPYKISKQTLIRFYFWNIIANLDEKKGEELFSSFLNIATLEERNSLEAELSKIQYSKFTKLVQIQKTVPSVHYEIKNAEKCEVFLNGKLIEERAFELSVNGKNILNAICENGFYAQNIGSDMNTTITIEPHLNKVVLSMPTIQLFPIKSFENKKIQSLVFIHWSSQKHYIQTVVINPSNLADKRELILQLKTKEDLRITGDKIAQFIFNSSQFLIN